MLNWQCEKEWDFNESSTIVEKFLVISENFRILFRKSNKCSEFKNFKNSDTAPWNLH